MEATFKNKVDFYIQNIRRTDANHGYSLLCLLREFEIDGNYEECKAIFGAIEIFNRFDSGINVPTKVEESEWIMEGNIYGAGSQNYLDAIREIKTNYFNTFGIYVIRRFEPIEQPPF